MDYLQATSGDEEKLSESSDWNLEMWKDLEKISIRRNSPFRLHFNIILFSLITLMVFQLYIWILYDLLTGSLFWMTVPMNVFFTNILQWLQTSQVVAAGIKLFTIFNIVHE